MLFAYIYVWGFTIKLRHLGLLDSIDGQLPLYPFLSSRMSVSNSVTVSSKYRTASSDNQRQ
jgi:hypothetical protein